MRTLMLVAQLLFVAAANGQSAAAIQYPNRPVRQIVPFAPGGSVDIVTTFDVFVGLTAIASSASLPGIALVSKTDGSGAAAASPVVASATASARTIIGHLDRNRRLRMRHPFLETRS